MEESKEIIVLGAIKNGAKKFDKIQKTTKIDPKELDDILQRLEKSQLIKVEEKNGWFGTKVEIKTTQKGDTQVEQQVHELETKWGQMSAIYKTGDKKKLKDYMDENKSFLPMMMFFGIMDMMMFSMMFSMMGATMTDYVPAQDMPADMDGMDGADGGFDIDLGF